MPIPSPGLYDLATQTTSNAIKAKTDLIGASVALESGGNIAAIKAKTDLIPADIGTQIDTNIPALLSKAGFLHHGVYTISASDYPQRARTGWTSVGNGAYAKMIEFAIPSWISSATLRIVFGILAASGTTYGKIYKNGAAFGTERSTAGGPTDFSEDLIFAPNDLCQIWAYNTLGSGDGSTTGMAMYGTAVLTSYISVLD